MREHAKLLAGEFRDELGVILRQVRSPAIGEFIGRHGLDGVEVEGEQLVAIEPRRRLDRPIEIEMLDQDYKGHYVLTPYTFSPTIGVKLVNNPSIDFGQGLLECINQVFHELQEEGVLESSPVPESYSE